MDINRNNYEAFLLDLLEGRLSAGEERELKVFLKDHPEFVVDLPDLDLFRLEKQRVLFAERDQLKKEFPVEGTLVSEANFDMYSIARMEGDLSPSQEQDYLDLLEKDESKRKEWQDWQKTVLVPEKHSYPSKETLKKRNPVLIRRLWFSGLSVAATLTLLFILLRTGNIATGLADSGPSELPSAQVERAVPRDQAILSREQAMDPEQTEDRIPAIGAREPASENPESGPPIREERSPAKAIETSRTELQLARTDPGITQENIQENLNSPEFAEETTVDAETNAQLISDEIQARPLRIAGTFSGSSAMVGQASSDRIEPMPVHTVTARTSNLPLNEIAEIDRQLLLDEFTRENNISLLSVANAGIRGINKLTGSDISLMASRDEEGEVSGFRLKSKRFSISKPLSREE